MSNTSLIRVAIGEKRYKELNKEYALIEGYLFQKLDEVLILSTLLGLKYRINSSTIYSYKILDLTLSPNFSVNIVLNRESKRIGVRVLIDNSKVDRIDFNLKIQKKFNLQYSSTRHTWNADYDFKYSHRNCQTIVNVIKFLISLETELEKA